MALSDRSGGELSQQSEYESFADIYSVWADSAASTRANLSFYVDAYLAADGPVVELGVGDGRVAVEAAKHGCPIIGVDRSETMLRRCRERAAQASVEDDLTLIHADFRDFDLPEPAAMVALPYHSIGHLMSLDDKRDAVRHIYARLRPGGCFVFDDFFMTPALMTHMRAVQLRTAYQSATGGDRLLWVTSLVDEEAQSILVVTWEDALDSAGELERRRYRRLSLSWLEPDQARSLLEDAGFRVEACFGDFGRTPFSPASASEQIWVARKPD